MGGNVFQGTSGIKIEYIEPTVKHYLQEMKKLFPQKRALFSKKYMHYLGSVGKKAVSGDIDLGIDAKDLLKSFDANELKKWNLEYDTIFVDFQKMKKRSRTATDEELMLKATLKGISRYINLNSRNIHTDEKKIGLGTMFSIFPQYDENDEDTGLYVQMDWMVGNIDLLKFSYYSKTYSGNVKGLHRTQLMLAMFQAIDMSFSHTKGLSDKATKELITRDPKKMIQILNRGLGTKLRQSQINDYFKLSEVVLGLPISKKEKILDTYLRILDHTRTDIPENLQDYWKKNQSRLHLTGKFLPSSSALLEDIVPYENYHSRDGFKAYLHQI